MVRCVGYDPVVCRRLRILCWSAWPCSGESEAGGRRGAERRECAGRERRTRLCRGRAAVPARRERRDAAWGQPAWAGQRSDLVARSPVARGAGHSARSGIEPIPGRADRAVCAPRRRIGDPPAYPEELDHRAGRLGTRAGRTRGRGHPACHRDEYPRVPAGDDRPGQRRGQPGGNSFHWVGDLETLPASGGPAAVVRSWAGGLLELAGWWPDGSGLLYWPDSQGSASLAADGLPLDSIQLGSGAPRTLVATMLVHGSWIAFAPGGHELAVVSGGNREIWLGGKAVTICGQSASCKQVPQPSGTVSTQPAWSPASRLTFARGSASGPF